MRHTSSILFRTAGVGLMEQIWVPHREQNSIIIVSFMTTTSGRLGSRVASLAHCGSVQWIVLRCVFNPIEHDRVAIKDALIAVV
jgi:hypothetical protein